MLNVKELMQELEREDKRVTILSDYDINNYITESICETIDNSLIYYSDINELFEEADSDYKDSIISEKTFDTFNDYKVAVAFEYLYDYYHSIVTEMLMYATLDYISNTLDQVLITEEFYSEIESYIEYNEYSTLEELLNDLELL